MLRYINSIKQGNEPNVVIGPSMGGLITRYALAYMEQQLANTGDNAKWNHETRLWVSFDSPHQGANIPIGVQKGIQYYAEERDIESAKDFIAQLDKPAPKQMLVNHYSNTNHIVVGAPNFRNRFQNELNALGMPQNLRKIALINGSINGNLNGISKAKYLELNSNPALFSTLLGGEIKVSTDYYHTANEKNGVKNEVFYGRTRIKYNVLGLFNITKTFGKSKYPHFANNNGSYDISPGGYFNAQQQLAQESSGLELAGLIITNSNLIDSTHSFIPTKSALAYTGSNVLDEIIGNKDRVCTRETPFDNYFAPKQNEEHITLTTENVDWLKAELDVMTTNPPPTIYLPYNTGNNISGNITVCTNLNNVFTLNVPTSCSGQLTWSVSNNMLITSQNGNSVTVTPTSIHTAEAGYISVKIENTDIEVKKYVWVGKPANNALSIQKTNGYTMYSNQWTTLTAIMPLTVMQDYTPYNDFTIEWNIPNSYINTYSNTTSKVDIKPYYNGSLNIGARAKNNCGCSSWTYRMFNVVPQPGTGGGGGNNDELIYMGFN